MKKVLIALVALAVGAVVFNKVRSGRNEADLWQEATTS